MALLSNKQSPLKIQMLESTILKKSNYIFYSSKCISHIYDKKFHMDDVKIQRNCY